MLSTVEINSIAGQLQNHLNSLADHNNYYCDNFVCIPFYFPVTKHWYIKIENTITGNYWHMDCDIPKFNHISRDMRKFTLPSFYTEAIIIALDQLKKLQPD